MTRLVRGQIGYFWNNLQPGEAAFYFRLKGERVLRYVLVDGSEMLQ